MNLHERIKSSGMLTKSNFPLKINKIKKKDKASLIFATERTAFPKIVSTALYETFKILFPRTLSYCITNIEWK